MRRVVGLVFVLLVAARAHADTLVTAEAGSELDDNVQRVETGGDATSNPVSAWVLRFGARVEHKAKLLGGTGSVDVSNLTRVVSDTDVSVENVTALAANARWIHVLPDRPVALGGSVNAIDAFPISDDIGARTFRNLGADAMLALRGGDDRALTLSFGARDFVYKPDHDFDWRGPSVGARFDFVLWQTPSKTKSLELVTSAAFEARTFDSVALTKACPPFAPPDPNCIAASDLDRRDRYQRMAVELTWVGRQVAALGYQLTLIDSNSFGQSLARHRVTASGTAQLPGEIYGSVLAILQIDQYLDGLVVRRDLQQQEFTNVEDENRSSLQVRLARRIAGSWSVEGRAAIWRNIAPPWAGRAMQIYDFQRELVYLGLVFGR